MKSGVGSALGGCASTVKQADIGSQGDRIHAFNSQSFGGNRHTSEHQ
jgi:hypothetical protein